MIKSKKSKLNNLEEDLSDICNPLDSSLLSSLKIHHLNKMCLSPAYFLSHKEKLLLSPYGSYLIQIKSGFLCIKRNRDERLVFSTKFKPLSDCNSCFSHDERLLAIYGYEDKIEIIETGSWVRIFVLAENTYLIQFLCFSNEGDLLSYSLANSTIKIWKIEGKQLKYTLKGTSKFVLSLCFHPDDKFLAVGAANKAISIWNIKNQEKCLEIDGTEDAISLHFSDDGKVLASILYEKIMILSIITEKNERFNTSRSISIYAEALCFVSNTKILTMGSAGFNVLDFNSKNGLINIVSKSFLFGNLKNASFTQDRSLLLTESEEGKVVLYDVQEIFKFFTAKTSKSFFLNLSADNKFLAETVNRKIFVRDMDYIDKDPIVYSFSNKISLARFSEDCEVLGIISNKNKITIIELSSVKISEMYSSHQINLFVFNSNHTLIAAFSDKEQTIFYLNEITTKITKSLIKNEKFRGACFSKEGALLIATSTSNTLTIKKMANNFEDYSILICVNNIKRIELLAISSLGKYMAINYFSKKSKGDQDFSQMKLFSLNKMKTISKHNISPIYLAFSLCEKYLIYSLRGECYSFKVYIDRIKKESSLFQDDKFYYFDELSGYQLKTVSSEGNLAFLKCEADMTLIINLQEKIFEAELNEIKKDNLTTKKSPCNRFCMMKTSHNIIQVKSSDETSIILTLKDFNLNLKFACFSHQSQLLAIAPLTRPVEIWNINSKCKEFCFGQSVKKVYFLEFSKEDNFLVVGILNTHILIWNVLKKAKEVIIRESNYLIKGFSFLDSQILATRMSKSTIKLWNYRKKVELMKFKHVLKVQSMSLTINKKYFIVGSTTNKICTFKVENKEKKVASILADSKIGSIRKIRKLE